MKLLSMVFIVALLYNAVLLKSDTETRSTYYKLMPQSEGKTSAIKSCLDDFSCALSCANTLKCRGALYDPTTKACTHKANATYGVVNGKLKDKAVFVKKVENFDELAYGKRKDTAVTSCFVLKQKLLHAASGVYWLDFGPHGNHQAYCDQETQDGGWTLVWIYTFTNYSHFDSGTNAITPLPLHWPIPNKLKSHSRISDIIPLSEQQVDAMDYNLWGQLGSEFLIMSNINNNFKCTPKNTGEGLVAMVTGLLDCSLVPPVVRNCTVGVLVPYKFTMATRTGPSLADSQGRISYGWDGDTTDLWPIHDPCFNSSRSPGLSGVENPYGRVYIR